MKEALELEIRKGYSNLTDELEALEAWLSGFLNEICYKKDFIHGFDVRIKTHESLIKKVNRKLKKGEAVDNFESVRNQVHDFVGARINVYLLSEMKEIHSDLIKKSESGYRIKVEKIKVHRLEGTYVDFVEDIEISTQDLSEIPIERTKNKTGYFGIHYLVTPLDQEAYISSEIPKYRKFEIQLRTLIQHSWSELEHEFIYKPRNKVLPWVEKRFVSNSSLIYELETSLDKVVKKARDSYSSEAPSFEVKQSRSEEWIIDKYKPLHSEITNLMREVDNEIISTDEFKKRANYILDNDAVSEIIETSLIDTEIGNESSIDSYPEKIFTRNLTYTRSSSDTLSEGLDYNTKLAYSKVVVAYLFLRANRLEDAYLIYSDCKQYLQKNESKINGYAITLVPLTLYVRFAECCFRIGGKEEEYELKILESLDSFENTYNNNRSDIGSDSHILFSNASILNWQMKRFSQATKFARVACEFSDREKPIIILMIFIVGSGASWQR